jgi:hypothetical protein
MFARFSVRRVGTMRHRIKARGTHLRFRAQGMKFQQQLPFPKALACKQHCDSIVPLKKNTGVVCGRDPTWIFS